MMELLSKAHFKRHRVDLNVVLQWCVIPASSICIPSLQSDPLQSKMTSSLASTVTVRLSKMWKCIYFWVLLDMYVIILK